METDTDSQNNIRKTSGNPVVEGEIELKEPEGVKDTTGKLTKSTKLGNRTQRPNRQHENPDRTDVGSEHIFYSCSSCGTSNNGNRGCLWNFY